MVILFIGPSGSGKDTQANLLKKKLGYNIVSTGELLRQISGGDTQMQQFLKEDMNKGFAPDMLIYGLLEVYLKESNFDNFVLTGGVRRASQVDLLDATLENYGDDLDKVFYFKLSDEDAINRLKNRLKDPVTGEIYNSETNPPPTGIEDRLVKRTDDSEIEFALNRLRDFYKDSEQIVRKYKSRGILVEIDASKTIEEIYAEIVMHIENPYPNLGEVC